MNNPILWTLLFFQMAMGTFDILFHHELTERLAWRPSQRKELTLHGIRNFAYAALFLIFGWFEPHGLYAVLLVGLLAAETVITLIDFVEEDRSRLLPASERVTHTLLALNYGAILALALPTFVVWVGEPSAMTAIDHGWWSVLFTFAAPAVSVFGIRDLAAAARLKRLPAPKAAGLARALTGRKRVLVTGATGFVGRRLVAALASNGHDVIALVRSTRGAALLAPPVRIVTSLDQIAGSDAIDAIVNLAGEPIANGLWTRAKRRRILSSRLRVTRDVLRLIARMETRPSVLVNASAIGWYGLRDDECLTETSAPGNCFSHRICAHWEAFGQRAERQGVRVVRLRIGLVLGTEGGMLGQMLPAFEYGLGGPFGSGKHWMSWIERDDLIRLIVHAIATPSLSGPLNATAPQPVRNRDFVRALGRALHRPAAIPIPALPLLWAAGDLAKELFLSGQRVLPGKATETGFVFEHPTLEGAFIAILGARKKRPNRAIDGVAPLALPREPMSHVG